MDLVLKGKRLPAIRKLLAHILDFNFGPIDKVPVFLRRLMLMNDFLKQPIDLIVIKIDSRELIVILIMLGAYLDQIKAQRLGEPLYQELLDLLLYIHPLVAPVGSPGTFCMTDYHYKPVTYRLDIINPQDLLPFPDPNSN